ncbi:carboxylesterase family protein [Camillea tinctor]|nr:carboxylesterase family protein [Camillea tinctor]
MLLQTVLLGLFTLITIVKTEITCQQDYWSETIVIFLFKNVRFGTVPVRFGRSISPDWLNDTVQNIDEDISCIQLNISNLQEPPGGRPLLGDPMPSGLQSEDCLYLDIYVPVSAFQSETKPLPVVQEPDGPLYSGQSILNASNYQTIFITGNYRVGASGWLAGDYMQAVGQPNNGLYDQALLLEWVRDHVHLLHGDKDRVSAWGESAGASSIRHHLVREDGKQDPLFRTFAVQSPAFQWSWDNSPNGTLDNIYRLFSNLSGCGYIYNISCLRNASLAKLIEANQELFHQVKLKGYFPVGPAVDGDWIKSIPTVQFSQGNYWREIDSAIISHCANEAHSFTPNISTPEKVDEFLHDFFSGEKLEDVRTAIREQYNCTANFSGDFHLCLATTIQDAMFTCNTRDLFDAYPNMAHMMQYEFPIATLAYHASDLIPLFTNNKREVIELVGDLGDIYAWLLGDEIPWGYKRYFASFALSGDPNTGIEPPILQWPVADGSSDRLSNVMDVSWGFSLVDKFRLVKDNENKKSTCSFWTDIAKNITLLQLETDGKWQVSLPEDPDEL